MLAASSNAAGKNYAPGWSEAVYKARHVARQEIESDIENITGREEPR